MKKIQKIVVYITFIFSFFLLSVNDVDANSPICAYGRKGINNDLDYWIKYVEIKLEGYDGNSNGEIISMSNKSFILGGGVTLGPCSNGDFDLCFKGKRPLITDYTVNVAINLFPTRRSYELFTSSGVGEGCPPRVQLCEKLTENSILATVFDGGTSAHYDIWIYRDSLTQTEVTSKGGPWIAFWDTSDHRCYTLNHSDLSDDEYYDDLTQTQCATYDEYTDFMKTVLRGNPDCSTNAEFNKLHDELKALCDQYSASASYATNTKEGVRAKKCRESCSELRDDVSYMCGYEGEESSSKACSSIGDRLLEWIFRIIRIMRYIVPALLILLGVVDFLKAIASQNDDELKKAGSRFAKRLLAAAIVFIIPLILQFVFGIFNLPGLDPNNPFCAL